MPIAVTCASCAKQFQAPDAYAGKQAKCSQCGAPIAIPLAGHPAALPARPSPPRNFPAASNEPVAGPPPPLSEPSDWIDAPLESFGTADQGADSVLDDIAEQQFEPRPAKPDKVAAAKAKSFSLWHLLDWRFEHYLTPWIVRAYWILVLTTALLVMIYVATNFTLDQLAGQPEQMNLADLLNPKSSAKLQLGGTSLLQSTRNFTKELAFFGLQMVLVVSGVLAIRVACEAVIVFYNIAKSASAIEKALAVGPLGHARSDVA